MPSKDTLSTWKKESTDTDVLSSKAEQARQNMETRIYKEAKRADTILLCCTVVLFVAIVLTFILCFETWALDSPTGFWMWNKKWWGL